MVDDDEKSMTNGDQCTLFAFATSQSAVLGLEVASLLSRSGPSRLGESSAKPSAPLGGLPTLIFAGTFVTQGAHSSPGGKVFFRGEPPHVASNLSDHILGRTLLEARQAGHLLDGFLKRAADHRELA